LNPSYPRGTVNAHWFNFFNAVAFQIMMGAPIILFAKSLGASSTVIGIIASFTPLMTIFQLPAARFMDRVGYRHFALAGWGIRTGFIFVVAAVPLMAFLDNTGKMSVLLAALFVFNLLRGISSAAWLPWIAALIPESLRGRFLSRDQLCMYAGSLVSLLASSILMAGRVDPWEYALVFLVSALGGTASLYFINRIPDAPAAETVRISSVPVPWLAMLRFGPFLRLVVFNVITTVVFGSLGVFTVEYLRDVPKFTVADVLVLSAFSLAGAMVALVLLVRRADARESKPILRLALVLFGVVILVWWCIAGKVIPAKGWIIAALNLLAGVGSGFFNFANVRIAMATMPEMGRNHFFAMFSVITSLGLGASPIFWGLMLDALGTFEAVTGAFAWRRHAIYFAAIFFINAAAVVATGLLTESLRKPSEPR
jgi:MFS family permease